MDLYWSYALTRYDQVFLQVELSFTLDPEAEPFYVEHTEHFLFDTALTPDSIKQAALDRVQDIKRALGVYEAAMTAFTPGVGIWFEHSEGLYYRYQLRRDGITFVAEVQWAESDTPEAEPFHFEDIPFQLDDPAMSPAVMQAGVASHSEAVRKGLTLFTEVAERFGSGQGAWIGPVAG